MRCLSGTEEIVGDVDSLIESARAGKLGGFWACEACAVGQIVLCRSEYEGVV
jgi:hypothetical protein